VSKNPPLTEDQIRQSAEAEARHAAAQASRHAQLDYMIAQQVAAALEAIFGSEEDRFKAAASRIEDSAHRAIEEQDRQVREVGEEISQLVISSRSVRDQIAAGSIASGEASNAYGRQMHEAVDILESAIPTTDSADVYTVTHEALASAIKVIARADDSSGIIGDACRRLLELHPIVAAAAQVPAGNLADWMVRVPVRRRRRLLRDRPCRLCTGTGQVGDGDLSRTTVKY
jgi:hypothetical protein